MITFAYTAWDRSDLLYSLGLSAFAKASEDERSLDVPRSFIGVTGVSDRVGVGHLDDLEPLGTPRELDGHHVSHLMTEQRLGVGRADGHVTGARLRQLRGYQWV